MDIAQAIGDGHRIKGVVRKRQTHAVASNLGHITAFTCCKHAAREITGHAPRTGLGQFDGRHRRSGGKVQDLLPRLQVKPLAGQAAPPRVLAKRQHRVGDVILLAHRVKHARNIEGLFLQICLRHKSQV